MRRALLLAPLCACWLLSAAENAEPAPPEQKAPCCKTLLAPLDAFQRQGSRIVRRFSSNVDSRLSRVFEEAPEGVEEDDDFYLIDYFVDETAFDAKNHSYIRLVGGYEYDRLGHDSQILDMTARILLPKTQNRLQLFIGDETRDTGDLSTLDTEEERLGIGIRYYLKHFSQLLHPSVMIGFSGITNPYIRLRVGHRFASGRWFFKPTQAEKAFEEWTDLQLAYRTSSERRLNLLLRRSTESETPGMNYFAQLSYFRPTFHHTGLRPYIGCYGRTQSLTDPYESGRTPEAGLYNYTAGVIWKDDFLRDYLFYQVHPAVEYHEQYGYRPNYILRLTLELYLGEKR